ncbi:CopG family ribbon-helix-helix protein [Pelomicrobium sp. G1]|uniref:CopG family ribbon-helix-helix protein n=1 Tax=unclassified Pelomicrobium TaxID=2815318 RepID=UPI0021DE68A2|nr:MAG: hypothetical protein KatS3mg123_1112 [Burkholderiales bacterium]
MGSTTTLKLPQQLKERIAALAEQTGRSPHALMLEAIEREVARGERMRSFVEEAIAADRRIDATGEVFAADEVHAWIERLARKRKAARPKPWRK